MPQTLGASLGIGWREGWERCGARPRRSRVTLRLVLGRGDPVPDVTVWTAPNKPERLAEILAGGPALVLFYLFDWSGT